MSEQKEIKKELGTRKVMNMYDIQAPQFTDVKELLTIRQGKRTGWLEEIAKNLVIDIPTRSQKGGPFDTVTRLEYHAVDDDQWYEMQMEKAKQFDIARSMQLDPEEYKINKIPLPKNWTTLSTDYYLFQEKVNDLFCKNFLGRDKSELKLCDQQMLQDLIDAYELKHRLGLVNLEDRQKNSKTSSSIM